MNKKELKNLIDVANKKIPADLVIKNAQIFNGFLGKFIQGDLAISGQYIAAVGDYQGIKEFQANGSYLTPGFIDGHVHIESSMASPQEFTKILLASGVTTIIADPHEIANAKGLNGLEYILKATENAPVNVYMMLPSCVPATPLEKGGAELKANDLKSFIDHKRVLGLGEMMDYPGVINAEDEILDKLLLAKDKLIDGHAPRLKGKTISTYAAAGIRSDHECSTAQELTERLANGITVMLREGSAAKNLLDLLPAVNLQNSTFCYFATDDRHAEDLITEGSINNMVRLAHRESQLELGAILNMASLNAARHYGLRRLGAISPGYLADIALYPDLTSWKPSHVWKNGTLAFENGKTNWTFTKTSDILVKNSLKLAPREKNCLTIKASGANLRVIGIIPNQLTTKHLIKTPKAINGEYMADPEQGMAKLAVLERYNASGKLALGMIEGLGLKKGAIASTIAHDSHNLIVAGMNDSDMLLAIDTIEKMGGGLAVTNNGKVLGSLPLPLGGLLSDLAMESIAENLKALGKQVEFLGLAPGNDPFLTLAFMSLPIIPSLKLTVNGLVDVEEFKFVPLVF